MSASRQTRGRLNMQPSGLNIYAARSCTENARFCRRQVERQVIWLEAALGRPGQVIAMAFGAIPTVIGGPAVLVAVRIGVTVSPLKFRT
jgi:hypothetical protein